MSLMESTSTTNKLLARRRFSADEIRRQPEFRAIIASSGTGKQDSCKIYAVDSYSTTADVVKPNEGNIYTRWPRSYSSPDTDSQHPPNTPGGQSVHPAIWRLTLSSQTESNFPQRQIEHFSPRHESKETLNEFSSIIMKNDEDCGISVVKNKSEQNVKNTSHNEEEKTESHLVCHKIVLKKKQRKSSKISKEEMRTVYEETLSGNSEKDPLSSVSTGTSTLPSAQNTNAPGNGLNDRLDNNGEYSRQIHSAPGGMRSNLKHVNDQEKKSPESAAHNFHTHARKVINAIRFQKNAQDKVFESEDIMEDKPSLIMRQTSTCSHHKYDAKLEESAVYLRSRNRTFTRATQFMEKPKSGIRQLNVHYSQTNSCHNDKIIFTDLLKHSHVQNAVIADGVYAMERRLYNRRHEKGKSTTFYDRFITLNRQRPQSSPLPRRSERQSLARTVAAKNKERKERIQKKEEFIEMGYVPRMSTLETKGPEIIEDILMSCRHLRVKPDKQPWLYVVEKQ